VQFELAVAGVEMSVIGKSRSSVHQLMERSIPSTLPEVRTPEKKVEKKSGAGTGVEGGSGPLHGLMDRRLLIFQ